MGTTSRWCCTMRRTAAITNRTAKRALFWRTITVVVARELPSVLDLGTTEGPMHKRHAKKKSSEQAIVRRVPRLCASHT